ncbi:hypothetical protein AB0M48_35135 [Lentzea sp. NPDC051208]|uniref:hypothetical protein n=1 Tax=Lentzea sp. NPDC051208 TaxID=3154642 RepID=UPI00341E4D93
MRATRLLACVGASLVFIMGFGMMNLFWLNSSASAQQLPGLYDFYSATWGDGIFLPVATAALIVILSRVDGAGQPVPRPLIFSLAGAGVLIGSVVQVMWLLDPAPRLNWTLPEPHRFTLAGWYHAAFFAGVSSVFLVLLGVLLYRLTRRRRSTSPKSGSLHGAPLTTFVLAEVGFATLVVRDGIDSPFTFAQLATWGAVASAAIGVFVLIIIVARDSALGVLFRVPAILIWVSTIIIATYLPWHYRIAIFGVVALGVCVALVLGREAQSLTWATGIQLVAATFVSVTYMSGAINQWPNNITVALIAPIVAMGACALFLLSGFGFKVSWVDLLAAGVHLLIVAAAGLYLTDAGIVANPIVLTTALALASFLQVTVTRQLTDHRFQRLVEAESVADKTETMEAAGAATTAESERARHAVASVKREVWTWMVGTYFAAVVAVLTLTRGAVVSKGFQPGGESEWLSLIVLLFGAGFVCLLAGTTALLARYLPQSKRRQLWVFLPAILGTAAWVWLIISIQAVPHRFYYAPWACAAAIVMGLVTYESIISNVSRLNRETPTPVLYVTAVGLGMLSAVNSYWLLAGVASGPGIPETQLRALGAVVIVVVVQLTILMCVGYAAQAGLKKLRTRYTTSFNLFQDGILFLGLTFVFGFVPLFVYRHLEPLTMQRSLEIAFALGPTLTFAGGLMVMTLMNNREHLRRKEEIADATEDYDGMPIAALKSHIRFQNRMAITLAAITLVGLANAMQNIKELREIIFHGDIYR